MALTLSLLLVQAAATQATGVATVDPNLEDKRIVCRTVIGTGSRLNNERICLPKKEWRRMHDQGRETTGSLQNHHSKRIPNT